MIRFSDEAANEIYDILEAHFKGSKAEDEMLGKIFNVVDAEVNYQARRAVRWAIRRNNRKWLQRIRKAENQ
jgi:hypothetical protein